MYKKILSIDPSGSGTTALCIVNKSSFVITKFIEFKNDKWEKHLLFIIEAIKDNKPEIVLYETTNYIHCKTQSSLDLMKLIGAIVGLKYSFPFIQILDSMAVNQVKAYKDKIWNQRESIVDLTFQAGRGHGWKYQERRISLHQLDAFLVFFLWEKIKKR